MDSSKSIAKFFLLSFDQAQNREKKKCKSNTAAQQKWAFLFSQKHSQQNQIEKKKKTRHPIKKKIFWQFTTWKVVRLLFFFAVANQFLHLQNVQHFLFHVNFIDLVLTM